MLLKIYTIGSIVVDIIILLVNVFITMIESIYEYIFPPPPNSVAGEIVLVTGAGHGIGREISINYASKGAVVVCLDLNEKGNEETVKMIKSDGYSKVHAYTCDVTKRDEVHATVKKITAEVGHVTILVNNAGIMPCHRLLNHKPEEIVKIFEVNVFAHFWLLEAVLPHMIEQNHGHIVALSSIAGMIGLRNLVPYCASKFAVRGLMEAMVEEFREEKIASGVNFTLILPYMTNTGLCKNPKINQRMGQLLALLSPKLVAEHIVDAQRRNKLAITIPSFFMLLNDVVRLFPFKAGQRVKDFLDSGMEPDESVTAKPSS